MIFVPDPIYNEPGIEGSRGSTQGEMTNITANKLIRVATLRHAVLDHLRAPKNGFEEAIRLHFLHRRSAMTRTVQRWIDEAESGKWRGGADGRKECSAVPNDRAHAATLRGLLGEIQQAIDRLRPA